MSRKSILCACILGIGAVAFGQAASGWKAGVARVKITPEEPMWLAGYASRNHPMEGVRQDVWAKALAMEDGKGHVGVIVTLDLCGIQREMTHEMLDVLNRRYGLKPDQVIFNASHTHSGPLACLSPWLVHPLTEADWERTYAFTRRMMDKVTGMVGDALARRSPAKVSTGSGFARFAVNRRRNVEKDLTPSSELKGPVDHAVPVLKVEGMDGKLRAVLFGYACHNTVLSEYLVCGDYAGYAQEEVERLHPGATALFFQGAGADQNPLPRRKASLAMQYGRELAAAVEQALADEMKPREPVLLTKCAEVMLAMEEPVSAAQLEKLAKEKSWRSLYAKAMIAERAKGAKPAREYPYPVQYWRIGDQKLFTLGGEVMCGYSLAVKGKHGADAFVMGYSNDVMAYIPMPEMWDEGGYEIRDSHICYGLPAPWKRDVTRRILDTVDRLVSEGESSR